MQFNKFKNVFTSESGTLLRKDDCAVVRPVYQATFTRIINSHQMRATLRNGGYTWPGGYPLYFHTYGCDAICFNCAVSHYKEIAQARHYRKNDDEWGIVACDVNYENNDLFCDHCNTKIELAYGNEA